MTFQISGLDPRPFQHLFDLSDDALAAEGAIRYVVDRKPGFPERIEMRDAEVGERLLLVNYTHQPAATPYRSSHAVFVREGAEQAYKTVGEVPEVMRRRLISLRAFDVAGMIVDADVAEGEGLEPLIHRLFADPRAAYLHAHYAKFGCFAARIDRA